MNRASLAIGAGLLVAASSFAHPRASQQDSNADRTYAVGVVRADGAIIPFAQFDRGLWKPIWQDAIRGRKDGLPLTLDAVKKEWWGSAGPSLKWTLWPGAGPSVPLSVSATRAVATPCGAQPALATGYKPESTLPPPQLTPYPKIGIATTAPVDIEPIGELTSADADWQRVERALHREFDDAEGDALGEMGWSHPTRRAERSRAPIDLQSVWHVKGSRFFYVEAMRRYPDPKPPKGKPACDLVTYVAGYLWDSPSEELVPAGVSALITYCHMDRATFMWPFAVIREGTKQYWIFQAAGWSAEVYAVDEPVPGRGQVKHHVRYAAGYCE